MAILKQEPYPKKSLRIELRFDEERDLYTLAFPALGTVCRTLFHSESREQAIAFSRQASNWVASFEGKYSRFLDTSLVSKINRSAGLHWVEVDQEAEDMFALADELYRLSEGALDPTALPLLQLWDFRGERTRLPSEQEVAEAKANLGWQRFERRSGAVRLPEEGMCIDLGCFGKEYAVDQVANLARACGIERALVDFGQDIKTLGRPLDEPAWLVGLEKPDAPGESWTQLALEDGMALASSGNAHRSFIWQGVRYGHIVNLDTGFPVSNELRMVTVLADSCLHAGLLSTAGFVKGGAQARRLIEGNFKAEYCLLSENGYEQSPGFYEQIIES